MWWSFSSPPAGHPACSPPFPIPVTTHLVLQRGGGHFLSGCLGVGCTLEGGSSGDEEVKAGKVWGERWGRGSLRERAVGGEEEGQGLLWARAGSEDRAG